MRQLVLWACVAMIALLIILLFTYKPNKVEDPYALEDEPEIPERQRGLLTIISHIPPGNCWFWVTLTPPKSEASTAVGPFEGPMIAGIDPPHANHIEKLLKRGWLIRGYAEVELNDKLVPFDGRFAIMTHLIIERLEQGHWPTYLPPNLNKLTLTSVLKGKMDEVLATDEGFGRTVLGSPDILAMLQPYHGEPDDDLQELDLGADLEDDN